MARKIDLPISSRLNATPFLQVDNSNTYFFGVWGRIEFPPKNDDRIHTVTKRDIINWPGLAHDFYRNPERAWVIWVANNISDPWKVTVGTRIRIPSITNVDIVLSSITKDAE